ncbi:hypothetical protein [Sinorhizobium medicae]|uniref:hypothetical protein n=1 Tax=Sinorhizobium medicae TaxID=110321 RepID=UPI0012D721C9|nr:hypothetical protein [Sinorhizobium medicae]
MTTWMQRVTQFPGVGEQIQERFDELFMESGAPEQMVLFCRTTPDFQSEVFLLTPAAAKLTTALGGSWEKVDPFSHKWVLLVANGDVQERFGIQLGSDE